MGTPLDPVLSNIFKCDFDKTWVMTCKNSPPVLVTHVDDYFALFDNGISTSQFLQSQQSSAFVVFIA